MRRLLGLLLALGACDGAPGEACVGGLLQPDGSCVARCEDSLCLAGNVCVDNACVLVCDSHLDCLQGSQSCQAATSDGGAAIMACLPSPTPGSGLGCPLGSECQADLVCVSEGMGDGEAYCAIADCQSDADCGPGTTCGVIRDPRAICGTDKGDGGRCGNTDLPCVDPSMLSAEGSLIEGPDCLLRRTCVVRDDCAPCATDLDCSLVPGQRCATVGGESRCLAGCNVDADCPSDRACNAQHLCEPRGGACVGDGHFCAACRDDLDCGGGSWACMEVHAGERACLDLAFAITCAVDEDCPSAPSGLHGACLDETMGADPSSPVYHHCWFPYFEDTQAFHCWSPS